MTCSINRKVTFNPNPIALGKGMPFTKTKYDPHNCEICKIACNSKIMYSTHLKGKKHEKELKKMQDIGFECEVCNESYKQYDQWENHIKSKPHKNNERKRFTKRIMEMKTLTTRSINDTLLKCEICNLDCKSNIILQSHLTGSRHKKKLKMLRIDELKQNKDPSVICETCGIFLVPELMVLHQQSSKHKKSDDYKIPQKPKSNTEYCAICECSFSDLKCAIAHYQTSEHADNVKLKDGEIIWCDTCKLQLPNTDSLNEHLQGFKHYKILNKSDWILNGTFKEKLIEKKKLIKKLREQFRLAKDSSQNTNVENEEKNIKIEDKDCVDESELESDESDYNIY